FIPDLSRIKADDLSPDGDLTHLTQHLGEFDRRIIEVTSVNHVRIMRFSVFTSDKRFLHLFSKQLLIKCICSRFFFLFCLHVFSSFVPFSPASASSVFFRFSLRSASFLSIISSTSA